MLEFSYPPYTTLSVTRRVVQHNTDAVVINDVIAASASISTYRNYNEGPAYYWDDRAGCVLAVNPSINLDMFNGHLKPDRKLV